MILAIETSTATASLALYDPASGAVVQRSFTSDRAHNAAIFQPLEDMLSDLDAPLKWIVTGTGPGSYSGIRVGIAVANGLAVAQECGVFGWPSLAAVDISAGECLAVGDARRRSFFAVPLKDHALQADPEVLTEEELISRVEAARSAGVPVITLDEKSPAGLEDVLCQTPSAGRLAEIAAALPEPEKIRLAGLPLEPIYIREPHITTPKPRTGPGRFIHGPDQEAAERR